MTTPTPGFGGGAMTPARRKETTVSRPPRERSCEGKRAHATRAEALAHLFALVRAGSAIVRLEAYRCKHCPSYHVGHRNKGRRVR